MTGANQKIFFNSNVQNLLSNRDLEFYELTKSCGITIDAQIFRILLELLRLDVSPTALYDVLHNMARRVHSPTLVLKQNTQNKSCSGAINSSDKKKPPVAAKPKKTRVEKSDFSF